CRSERLRRRGEPCTRRKEPCRSRTWCRSGRAARAAPRATAYRGPRRPIAVRRSPGEQSSPRLEPGRSVHRARDSLVYSAAEERLLRLDTRSTAAGTAAGCVVWMMSAPSRAESPKSGSPDSACRYFSGLFIPTASATGYFPGSDGLGPWFGGGLEVGIYGWSGNSQAFGPRQGKIRFGANVLGSPGSDGRALVMVSRG